MKKKKKKHHVKPKGVEEKRRPTTLGMIVACTYHGRILKEEMKSEKDCVGKEKQIKLNMEQMLWEKIENKWKINKNYDKALVLQ